MKYYERENGSLKVKEYKITKENVVQTLKTVQLSYFPAWEYTSGKAGDYKSMPNSKYPMNLAAKIAVAALEQMDDEFFKEWEAKEDERQADADRHLGF